MAVEWSGFTGNEMMWKWPEETIGYGSQCVVREDQAAVFFRDGKVYATLKPGRHTLTSNNVPGLRTLAKVVGKESPFICEIYYVCTKEFTNQKFGTQQPMMFRDDVFGMVQLRAFGTFSSKVVDPKLFITEFVGSRGVSTAAEAEEILREFIVRGLNDVLGEMKSKKGLQVPDIPGMLNELQSAVLSNVRKEIKNWGLEIKKIGGLTITLPDDLAKRVEEISAARAMNTMSGAGAFESYKRSRAIEEMGKGIGQGGGGGSVGMFGGAVVGAGAIGPMMAGTISGSSINCPKCNSVIPAGSRFCASCGTKLVTEQQEMKQCPKCSANIIAGSKFCPNCGSKF